ncbi:MerR family transcriptional regulator [uncultured Sulfitobacter sp.]|uniref:MerR family transcriptional regulator n=1 Tax=uncultured Sulfitobacter sp. TaxID=191468 RepID=UPI002604475A|nr:MerR family transcriptional regulator [uncultured Sulfitobacter sp.]
MRISDVADQTGIPISTIRYYEKRAIIPKPNRNGRDRSFSQSDVRAIQFVRDAQSLGLTLGEISTLLQGSWSKGEMAIVASAHRETVRKRIAALKRIDKVLSSLEMCHCNNFAECNMNAARCKQVD